MTKDEIIAEYLDTIKVQLVMLKFSGSPAKLRGKKLSVPMEFLAGIDTVAKERLRAQFKILSRGFDIDEELRKSGLDSSFSDYCRREDLVKQDFLYSVDGIGSVILNEDEIAFRNRVNALAAEAEALAGRLIVMLRDKVYAFAHQLYSALVGIWAGAEPEWWKNYKRENPLDSRTCEEVFCDLMFQRIETALSLRNPEYRVLLTRFNPDTMAESAVRREFKRVFCQYLRRGSGRDLNWLIGKDPNDRQAELFEF